MDVTVFEGAAVEISPYISGESWQLQNVVDLDYVTSRMQLTAIWRSVRAKCRALNCFALISCQTVVIQHVLGMATNSTLSLFSLQHTVALVTGGYRGLGGGISRALAEAGAKVYLNGRSESAVEEAASRFRSDGLDAHPAVFDINDESAAAAAVDAIVTAHGHIDILVNNAGIQRRGPLAEMSLEDFKLVLDTNLTAAFILGKTVAPYMIKQGGGKIINLCSLMSGLARPTTGNYAAAKGGLMMLTRSMTAEWASKNLQINGIGPGYFETEMTQVLRDDPKFDSWIKSRTPSGRWGKPEDLSGLAVFLASQASNYINGQLIYVDGGLTAVI